MLILHDRQLGSYWMRRYVVPVEEAKQIHESGQRYDNSVQFPADGCFFFFCPGGHIARLVTTLAMCACVR